MDYGKQLQVEAPAAGKRDTQKGLILLAAIVPAFFIRFLPYDALLFSIGAAAAVIGAMSVIATPLTPKTMDAFWAAAVFFLITIVCRHHPPLAAAAWGTWTWRKAALSFLPLDKNDEGASAALTAQAVSGFCAAAILIMWSSAGSLGLSASFVLAALLSGTATLIDRRLRSELPAPLGELASVVMLAGILGFNPLNMLYGQEPWLSLAVALVSSFFLYKIGLFGKRAAWLFTIYGAVVFFTLDKPGYAFFILYLLISEAGQRINRMPDNMRLMNIPGQFASLVFPATVVAAFSIGWDDPYGFYIAFAGSLSAAAFIQWNPARENPPEGSRAALRNFFIGFIGAALTGLCAVLLQFIPVEAVHIVLLAGISPPLAAQLVNVLGKPERDGKWLPAIFGAATAAFLMKTVL